MGALKRHGAEVGLAAVVVLIVGMMIVPLPTWGLDFLLASNLALALLLLLTALYVRRPISFAAFPTILLVTTLFRLALNVSSTRLILLQADAGDVIRAFGEFVVSGNYVVGAVVFAILTLIQFVVIARGSERVAEVGARFTLDAMPGKQLAIDADLRTGLLDAEGAAERRKELERESQFYGAMDGAMKFVKGDAIAALAITAINLVGGLAIGMGMQDLDAESSLSLYGLLTIGDGLVSQIPALLISTAAGLVVTRVASEDDDGTLGSDIGRQIFGDPRALLTAAIFLAVLALIPGLPAVPFAAIAALLAIGAWMRRERAADGGRFDELEGPHRAPNAEPIEVLVGPELARGLQPNELAEALDEARAALYDKLGVRLPASTPRIGPTLDASDYELRIAAVPIERGTIEDHSAARLVEQLTAALLEQPEALIGLAETQRELDALARAAAPLVAHTVPGRLALPALTRLLRRLVAERVSVRPLREILEAVGQDPLPEDPDRLLAVIRQRIGRTITHALVDSEGVLRVRPVDPEIEEAVRDAGASLAIDPSLCRDLVDAVREAERHDEVPAVLLTQADVRGPIRELLAAELPKVQVLSYQELDPAVRVERLGTVSATLSAQSRIGAEPPDRELECAPRLSPV